MLHKHILNIGYPKTGTTWLWDNLCLQPNFHAPVHKENNQLFTNGCDVNQYVQTYCDYNITGNFLPTLVYADRYIINRLSSINTISASLILRDPKKWMFSCYNFNNQLQHTISKDFNTYVGEQICSGLLQYNYSVTIKRWQQYFKDFTVLLYDDIEQNPLQFLENYFSTMGLPLETWTLTRKNVTNYTQEYAISESHLKTLNKVITELEQTINCSLEHWKTT